VLQLSPLELQERLAKEAGSLVFLDVREPWEYDICHISGSLHIPMGEIHTRLDELNTEHEWVVVCHHGMRSYQVAVYLQQNGFSKVINLAGGVDAWAVQVDLKMSRY